MMWHRNSARQSARDAQLAFAAAPILGDLRRELLVAPSEPAVESHLEAMRLERQFIERPQPRPARTATGMRFAGTRARRTTCAVAAVGLVFASGSLATAGAVTRPLQSITDTIKHTLFGTGSSSGLGDSPTQSLGLAPLPGPVSAGNDAKLDGRASTAAPAPPSAPTATPVAEPAPPSYATTGQNSTTPPSQPPRRGVRPSGSSPKPPPKHNSEKEIGPPPGLPADWEARAVTLARWNLLGCANSDLLAPKGCPQQAQSVGHATPAGVHWMVLNQPMAGAVVTIELPLSSPPDGAGSKVEVYGRFQMNASYMLDGDTTPRLVYRGGIARATMTWNGSSFTQVHFDEGALRSLPAGVRVALFERPASLQNADALSAVADGFRDCVIGNMSAVDGSVPNCPQHVSPAPAPGARWTLTGDPVRGAAVIFDARNGQFTVIGSYSMNLVAGNTVKPVVGNYAATLSFDGMRLLLIDIAAG